MTIRYDASNVGAFVVRGIAYSQKGDNDRAISDYSAAIRLDPKSSLGYIGRGRSHLFAGSAAKAEADFAEASKRDPDDAYNVLWADIAARRGRRPSRLVQTSSPIDMAVWPAPVIKMFMGEMTPDALLAAADNADSTRKKTHVCEAIFFSGELALTKGSTDEAARLFRLAANDCPRNADEWSAASSELKALGVVP
ncbi:tetratricopeptide repeat protein [Rhodopseudomonas sp. RCAM05734]|uniref:tetratricopeptide repeat protein n=1 Tax=Rhodopseudomonas sp. RCAM05734 TaxID=3457549 RepID=UPI0040450150